MGVLNGGFHVSIILVIVGLSVCVTSLNYALRETHSDGDINTPDWLSADATWNKLNMGVRRQSGKNPGKQKPKVPVPEDPRKENGNRDKSYGCTHGKTCDASNVNSKQGKCGSKVCSSDKQCVQMSQSRCKYCVSKRCSSTRSDDSRSDSSAESNPMPNSKRNRNVNRFTRVSRAHTWRDGLRPRETRSPSFGRCLLKKCTRPAQCKQNRGGDRVKRSGLSCFRCIRGMCSSHKKDPEVWKPRIREQGDVDKAQYGRLEIPGGDEGNIGIMLYRKADAFLPAYGKKEEVLYLVQIYTAKKYRRQGVATAFAEYFRDVVGPKHPNVKALKLTVHRGISNYRAVNLYKKYGFDWEDDSSNSMILYVYNGVKRNTPVL